MKRTATKRLAVIGLIAALYVVLTLPFGQIAFGPIQFRLAELLTLLPFFSPWAIAGVTLGCLLSNLLFSTLWDALFGTLATLIAAYFTYKSRHLLIAPLWPILFNGLIIGTMLTFMMVGSFQWLPWLVMVGEVAASETVVCYLLGIPFMQVFKKNKLDRYLK
jgi:uncharacterized membrane protein